MSDQHSQLFYVKGKRKEHTGLPSAEEQSRNEIRQWGVPRKPSQESEHLNEDEGEDDSNILQVFSVMVKLSSLFLTTFVSSLWWRNAIRVIKF